MQRATAARTCATIFVIFAVTVMLAGVAGAQGVNGALFTTDPSGITVNGNIYPDAYCTANSIDGKHCVYISGGPHNTKGAGLVPASTLYYFQVTDPSGAVLLSQDNIKCRIVVVDSNGRVQGVPSDDGTAEGLPGAGTPACYHANGSPDVNGGLPVQLCSNGLPCDTPNSYANTPNPGGEYKAWLTPVADYDAANAGACHGAAAPGECWGFVDADSKTDNFKVKQANAAYISVCKFNDLNGNGLQDSGEPLIPFWPVNASGVDTLSGPLGTVNTMTDATGCVSFSVTTFPNSDNTDTATLTENVLTGWVETAPLDGTYDVNGNLTGSGPTVVSSFTQTVTVKAGDNVTAPNFGNTCVNFDPQNGCGGNTIQLTVTKDANPSLTRTFAWGVTKSVDNTTVYSAGGGTSNPATYTVTVTHDSGTDSGWMVTGTIMIANPSLVPVAGVNVTDTVDNGGTCIITDGAGGQNETIPASGALQVPYVCTYTSLPANGTNTAVALSPDGQFVGTAPINFTGAAVNVVDGSVTVTDTLDKVATTLGTVSSTDPSPKIFTFQETFSDKAGTCTNHTNTASITTSTGKVTTTTNPVTVTDCQGADLTVGKTAAAAFNSSVSKSVNKTTVQQSGGSVTFNYTVTVAESAWSVTGSITVTNPNDWEGITATVGDALTDAGGVCTVNGGSNVVTVGASSSSTLPYTCTFAARPTAATGTNTATATWNAAAAHTPDGSASGMFGYTFNTLTITDNVQSSANPGGCNATLGTVSVTTTTPSTTPGCGVLSLASTSWGVFTYSITDTNSNPGTCSSYNNTAQITNGSSSNQVTVTVCNTNTGALTMGFWKNTNGAKIINAGLSTGGVCNSGTWLRQFNPFMDLSPTATCKQVASYVSTTIGAANCSSGGTCNLMLKAQMLATALDVYFSTPGLGGNQIGAYNGLGSKTPALGSVIIDLSHICSMTDGTSGSTCTGTYEDARSEFGIANSCTTGTTVNTMLNYADILSNVNGSPNGSAVSNSGGSKWYNQVKTPKQVYAKDGFDNTNNDIANIGSGPACSSMF